MDRNEALKLLKEGRIEEWNQRRASAEETPPLEKANLIEADLSDANLSGADLSRVDLSQANLSGADLSGADLSGAKLSVAFLSGANLSGAKLIEANLRLAFLIEANLIEANLSRANLSEANLSGANLSGAKLIEANLRLAFLIEANLSGANLIKANLIEAILIKADLRGATLSGATLSGANLIEADLRGADLRGADLIEAILIEANLSGANLSGANLIKANLIEAKLRGAKLRGAKLRGAKLRGANLSLTNLSLAFLSGANLSGAQPSPPPVPPELDGRSGSKAGPSPTATTAERVFEEEDGTAETRRLPEPLAPAAGPSPTASTAERVFEEEDGTAETRRLPEPLAPAAGPSPTASTAERVFEEEDGTAETRRLPEPLAPALDKRPTQRLKRLVRRVSLLIGRLISVDWRGADPVDCTVFAPPSVARGDWLSVQVFAHRPDQAEEARGLAQEIDQQARKRGFKSLEIGIKRGTRLTFHLHVPGIEFSTSIQSLIWQGRPNYVHFAAKTPSEFPIGTVIGRVTVSQDSIPIGSIIFRLDIVEKNGPPRAPNTLLSDTNANRRSSLLPVGDEIRRYKMAFISYAMKDLPEVIKRVQMLRFEGISYFQDLLKLEPGDRWERKLYHYIDRSDLFLLFWSTNAKQSKWVLEEVRYAIKRKGDNEFAPPEIFPVIIEGPPPPEPPKELAHLHFNDYLTYFMIPHDQTH